MEDIRQGGTGSTSTLQRLGVRPEGYRPGDSPARASGCPGVPGQATTLDESYYQIDILQSKSRWLYDEPGYVSSGFRTKRRLLEKLKTWPERAVFITLTYNARPYMDRDYEEPDYASSWWQEGCRKLYAEARAKRHLGEFLRRLREQWWQVYAGVLGEMQVFGVVEFQPKSGLLHWHLLINCSWIPKDRLAELWRHGYVKVKASNLEAVGYLAKYLVKGFDAPEWLLDCPSRIRLTSSTRGFWDCLGEPGGPATRVPAPRRPCPSIREIRRAPGQYLRTMMRVLDLATGEVHYRNVPMNICALVDLIEDRFHALAVEDLEEGHAVFRVSAGLDQLLYCGPDEPHSGQPPSP